MWLIVALVGVVAVVVTKTLYDYVLSPDPCPEGGCRGRLHFAGNVTYDEQPAAAWACTHCECCVYRLVHGGDVVIHPTWEGS